MKKMLYIVLCAWFITSCSNRKTEAEMSDIVFSAESDLSELQVTETLSNFNYEDLATQKLQEYLDLHILNEKHPEFESDINIRLKNLSDSELHISKDGILKKLENIRIKDTVQQISDSIQQTSFYFDIVTSLNTKTDSIIAIIKTNEIVLEGSQMKSTKVTFKNFQ